MPAGLGGWGVGLMLGEGREGTDLLGQEISADGGLVLVGELLVHVLVHERRLANTAVAEDDDLQQHFLARCRHDGWSRIVIPVCSER